MKSPRNSNIELLRILAMFMILILHANYFSINQPTSAQLTATPISAVGRVFFQMFAIAGVNIFVIISGWFGINTSIKGISKFIFQVVFILSVVYAIGLLFGKASINVLQISQCIALPQNSWFSVAYLGLLIFAPILNSYCSSVSEKQLAYTVLFFFMFQTIYGFIVNAAFAVARGYSTFSFMGLYLLARYMRLYGYRYYKHAVLGYLGSLFCMVCSGVLAVYMNSIAFSEIIQKYSDPLVILNALSLVIIFANRKYRCNRIVNFIASSCFAVYLVHNCNSWTVDLYKLIARSIFENYSGVMYLLVIFSFLVIVFAIGILIDQFRKAVWELLCKLHASKSIQPEAVS